MDRKPAFWIWEIRRYIYYDQCSLRRECRCCLSEYGELISHCRTELCGNDQEFLSREQKRLKDLDKDHRSGCVPLCARWYYNITTLPIPASTRATLSVIAQMTMLSMTWIYDASPVATINSCPRLYIHGRFYNISWKLDLWLCRKQCLIYMPACSRWCCHGLKPSCDHFRMVNRWKN